MDLGELCLEINVEPVCCACPRQVGEVGDAAALPHEPDVGIFQLIDLKVECLCPVPQCFPGLQMVSIGHESE